MIFYKDSSENKDYLDIYSISNIFNIKKSLLKGFIRRHFKNIGFKRFKNINLIEKEYSIFVVEGIVRKRLYEKIMNLRKRF